MRFTEGTKAHLDIRTLDYQENTNIDYKQCSDVVCTTSHNSEIFDSPQDNFDKPKKQTKNKTNTNTQNLLAQFDITGQLAEDYINHRKAKRSTISATVLQNVQDEAAKCNLTLQQAITLQIAQGWQGFNAQWVYNKMGLGQGKNTHSINTVHDFSNDEGGFVSWN